MNKMESEEVWAKLSAIEKFRKDYPSLINDPGYELAFDLGWRAAYTVYLSNLKKTLASMEGTPNVSDIRFTDGKAEN